MYGYVVPDPDKLRASDLVLYRSFYCGLCCQTGRLFGQLPRFTTNFDMAFFTALLHDYSKSDIVIEEHGCVLNPKKKAILQPNALLERIAAANVLLAYQKAVDGIEDGDGLKYKIAKRVLSKPYKTAVSICGDVNERITASYAAQRETEKNNVASVDRAADPFASLMRDLPALVIGAQTSDKMQSLCYNVGKFVYLADALDDVADDIKSKRYNPFSAAYATDGKKFTDRKSFIADNRAALGFCFDSTAARAAQSFYEMRFYQSRSLIENIVCDGLPRKAKELLNSTAKLKPPKI